LPIIVIDTLKSTDRTVKDKTVEKVCEAYKKAGIEFIDEDGGGPGVRLRKAGRKGK
jgi:hypothetical protein